MRMHHRRQPRLPNCRSPTSLTERLPSWRASWSWLVLAAGDATLKLACIVLNTLSTIALKATQLDVRRRARPQYPPSMICMFNSLQARMCSSSCFRLLDDSADQSLFQLGKYDVRLCRRWAYIRTCALGPDSCIFLFSNPITCICTHPHPQQCPTRSSSCSPPSTRPSRASRLYVLASHPSILAPYSHSSRAGTSPRRPTPTIVRPFHTTLPSRSSDF